MPRRRLRKLLVSRCEEAVSIASASAFKREGARLLPRILDSLLRGERSDSDPMSLSGGEGRKGGGGDDGGVGGSPRASPPSARPPVDVNVSLPPSPVEPSSNLGREKKGRLGNRDSSSLPPESIEELSRPARPGYGTEGHKYFVAANHFLAVVDDQTIFHYHVATSPKSKSKALNRRIINELVSLHDNGVLERRLPVYDGQMSFYTAGPLPFKEKDFTIELSEGNKGDTRKEKEFKVTIKHAAQVDTNHLDEFLYGRQIDAPQKTIQALNIVLRQSPSAKYVTLSRSFFSSTFRNVSNIGEGMECWNGYYQSLRPTQMGLSLNIDISGTSFYKSTMVVDFVAEYLNLHDFSKRLSGGKRIKIQKVLKGIKVETTHNGDFFRRYKITGITKMPLGQLMFPVDEKGNEISVVQYFRNRYMYPLKFTSWPCLQAGSETKPTYLPMEVCRIVKGQRYQRKLNERQVTKVLKATRQLPHDRKRSIMEIVSQNKFNDDKFVKEFSIKIDDELTLVDARILPPPKLKYHDSGSEKSCVPKLGQWNMIDKRVVDGGKVEYWTCLSFSSRLHQDEVHQFCNDLVLMCSNIGMVFNPRPFIEIEVVHSDGLELALRKVHRLSTEKFNSCGITGRYIELLVIILPETTGSYGRLKRICETELGIVTQCCLPRHMARVNKKKYLVNVALKINAKVGGRNTVLHDALHGQIPFLTDTPTIIFGAYVAHPGLGENATSSIAAVVASIDWPQASKYKGLVSAQREMEIIQDLFTETEDSEKRHIPGGLIRELLLSFYRTTKQLPLRIIFYRHGVSEGQFKEVLSSEVTAIRKACDSVVADCKAKITYVVVQKRRHTRFFPEVENPSLTDRGENISVGTVIDKMICHPTEFDFFLCSHAATQGTSRPAHYHVLYDENHFSADGIQNLTNNLCYTNARCTCAVSMVPPVHYARLAAYRARCYTEGDPPADAGTQDGDTLQKLPSVKENLKEVMFYC